jgi:hypothetical protein
MNIQSFSTFANCRKKINFIWKIEKAEGTWASNFNEIATKEVNYFGSIYKVERRATIAEILRLSRL